MRRAERTADLRCCHSPGRGSSELSMSCVMSQWAPRTELLAVVAQAKEVKARLEFTDRLGTTDEVVHLRSSVCLLHSVSSSFLKGLLFLYFFHLNVQLLPHTTIFGARCSPSCWD